MVGMADEGSPNLEGALNCPICDKRFTIRSSFLRHSRQCLERVVFSPRQKSCRQCYSAKTRCDQRQPCCSRCALRNHSCEYVSYASKIQREQTSHQKTRKQNKKASSSLEEAAPQDVNELGRKIPTPSTSSADANEHSLWDNSAAGTPVDYTFNTPASNSEPNPQYDPNLVQINNQSNIPSPEPPSTTAVPLSPHLPPTSPTEGVDITQVHHRWHFPSVEQPPTKIALMKQSMTLLSRVFRTYPQMMARKKQLPPFMHQNQLSSTNLPVPLANCFILTQIWQASITEGLDSNMVLAIIRKEMDRLFNEYQTYSSETLLATFQVLLIYSIILLFPIPQEPSAGTFDPLILVSLQELCFFVCQNNLILPAETAHTRPSYKDWITVNCKRRTVLSMYCFEWMYAVLNNLATFPCPELEALPAPAGKQLWDARTEEEWEAEYEKWLGRWKDGMYTMRELRMLNSSSELDRRSEMWLEETDEFGMVYMALANDTWDPEQP